MKNNLPAIIRKAIDLHVHVGPEIIPRKYTVEKLIKSEVNKLAGAVVKNHFYPTIALMTKKSNLTIYGSIVLNNFVGGINPEAVYSASLLSKKPFIVWFPTISAKQFLKKSKFEIAPEWVQKTDFKARLSKDIDGITIIDERGILTDNTVRVLKVIKQTGAVLATGHISIRESIALVKYANLIGIKKIVITHPIYQKIAMPISIQKVLVKYGAKIEHCYSMWLIDKIPISEIARQIKTIGANNTVLSSDVGQQFSPSPSQALYKFGQLLLSYKISLEELKTMMVTNPRCLVG